MSPRNVEPSLITLITNFVPKIRFEAVPGVELPNGTIERPSVTHKVIFNEQDDTWQVSLNLKVTWEACSAKPYSDISMLMVGIFRLSDEISSDPKKRDVYLTVAAPAVLYSASREFLRNLSSQGPYPPVILPTIRLKPGTLTKQEPKPAEIAAKKTAKTPARTRKGTKPKN